MSTTSSLNICFKDSNHCTKDNKTNAAGVLNLLIGGSDGSRVNEIIDQMNNDDKMNDMCSKQDLLIEYKAPSFVDMVRLTTLPTIFLILISIVDRVR